MKDLIRAVTLPALAFALGAAVFLAPVVGGTAAPAEGLARSALAARSQGSSSSAAPTGPPLVASAALVTVAPPAAITVVELGRLLFWDPILSGPKDVACGTCHHPDFAYGDGRELSLGPGSVGLGPDRVDRSGGHFPPTKRNSQTVLNTAYNGLGGGRGSSIATANPVAAARAGDPAKAPMFWNSRILSLELQALEPLKVREEMRGDTYAEAAAVDSVVARLRTIPEYVTLFEEAFGEARAQITPETLGKALADFQRTLVALNSPYDRYLAGDRDALTAQQLRGLQAFDRANCTFCHNGPLLSDFTLRVEGIEEHPSLKAPDDGDGRFQFRTPSLRNVALTAPYMHNGMIETLDEVIRFYDRRKSENPKVSDRPQRPSDIVQGAPAASLDWDIRFLNDIRDWEIEDMVAFFDALTDEDYDRVIPARVPSGLPPGGSMAPDGSTATSASTATGVPTNRP